MRPKQILNRPRRLLPTRLLAADPRPATPSWSGGAQGLGVDEAPQSGPQPPPHETGTFIAIGRTRDFPSPSFWSADDDDLLFIFHLHGFPELARYVAGERTPAADAFWERVLGSWFRECSTPARPAWHPFPMSGRIVAWCAALSAGGWSPELAGRMINSLAIQTTVLRRSVEHDIGGNHVLRNAVGLIFAGICLGDVKLERPALRLLENELRKQILPDGGHEERSTSYHREILGELKDVQALLLQTSRPAERWLDETVVRMRGWLAALTGPDGRLPLLNDAWDGPAVTAPALDGLIDLRDSGYVALRGEDIQAVLDLAPVAAPHLPPHAHADALSFVLWADGLPLVVDPGVLSYSGADRDWFRSTRAHNTVEVDGADQCEFWGPFRAARMPTLRRLRLDGLDDVVVVAGEHDGYRRLPDPVTHRRTFVWIPEGGLVVVDRLLAAEPHDAASFLHLAPGAELQGDHVGPVRVMVLGGGPDLSVEDARYARFLGTVEPARTLVSRRRIRGGETFGWALLREGFTASLDRDVLRVRRPGGEPIGLTVS